MGRTVIACYRAKPGQVAALHVLCAKHYAQLYIHGLVTRRLPLLLGARDGSVIELMEWKSCAADEQPASSALRRAFDDVCEVLPLAALPEASELFAKFEVAPIALALPPFHKVYNHVQVDARISTSGVISREVIEEAAREGYTAVINLLPDSNPHALANEAELVRGAALAYHHIPVDFAAPASDDYAAFERALDEVPKDKRVYIHCAANMRVSAFMAIYGTRRLGWTQARAADHIAEVWELNPIWRAFVVRESSLTVRS